MAKINVASACPVYNGMPVTFKAPCDCTAVDGLTVTHGENSFSFVFKDAHNNVLTGLGNLFAKGALVKVILDTVNKYAFLQNADTNAYIERTFARKDYATKVSLSATGWKKLTTGDGVSYYWQSLTIPGVTDDGVVDISLHKDANVAQAKEFMQLGLQDGGQQEDAIVLRAYGTVNTVDIPLNVVIRDYGASAVAEPVPVSYNAGVLALL